MEIDIRLCVDCLFADANGAGTPEHDGGPSSDWTGFLPVWDGWGFIARTERYGDMHEIKEPRFSWSPCDGCGCILGGDRFDFGAWEIRKDTA
jgi:hypothetical protein